MDGRAVALPRPEQGAATARLQWVALAALLLLHWLMALGAAPLFDVDEGAFAEASREMLVSGDWGHTTLNGADRFDKPILVYWLQAASLAVLGENEFAARLPSALCAWAWCLVLAAFAARRWGRDAGLWAAVLLATSIGPLAIGRAATADALLNLLLALMLLDLWRFFEQPLGHAAALRRAFAWMALGLLAKGPVAVVLPLGAGLLWAGLSGREGWALLRRALSDPVAWLIGLAIALPWYAYALARHGQRFIDGFIVHHNLARFGGPLEGHGGAAPYYLLVLPLLLLPWAPVWMARRPWITAWGEPLGRWLLAWTAFVLAFFSLSGTKLPHYVLYGVSPLILLAARQLATPPVPRLGLLAAGAGVAGVAVLGAVAPWGLAQVAANAAAAAAAVASPEALHWHRLLADGLAVPEAGPALVLAVASALVASVGIAVALMRLRESPGRAALGLALGAFLAAWIWTTHAAPWVGEALQGPVKRLALHARDQGAALVQWRTDRPSAAFYRGAPVPRRAPVAGEWALMREDRLPRTADETALRVHQRDSAYVLAGPR